MLSPEATLFVDICRLIGAFLTLITLQNLVAFLHFFFEIFVPILIFPCHVFFSAHVRK